MRLLALPALAAALAVTGCCGGYAVVRTTVLDRAAVREGGQIENGAASVLSFSRVGEPLGGCGPGTQYQERLWVQVPSLQAGQSFTIGSAGVVAVYQREQGGEKVRAKSITGTVTIGDRNADRVVAAVAVAITLATGEVVQLDSEYDFHPLTAAAAPAAPDGSRLFAAEERASSEYNLSCSR